MLHCLIGNCSIILVLCFNKGFLIAFGQPYFKQSSATRSKCFTQPHYAHSHVTNRGSTRIFYLLLWTKTDMTFSLTKGRGRKRICPLWRHTQPPFQWIRKELSLRVRGRGYKLPTGPPPTNE